MTKKKCTQNAVPQTLTPILMYYTNSGVWDLEGTKIAATNAYALIAAVIMR